MSAATEATRAIANLLAGHRYHYASEAELQTTIGHILTRDGYSVRREVTLDDARQDRIDFLIARHPNLAGKRRLEGKHPRDFDGASTPVIGIEAKVKGGNIAAIRRQVLRYLASDRVDGLVLVSNKFTHAAVCRGLPEEKPVLFACIARAA